MADVPLTFGAPGPRGPASEDVPQPIRSTVSGADRIFHGVSATAAGTSLVIIGTTAVFLAWNARPALARAGFVSFFTTSVWNASAGKFGVFGLLVGTVLIALIGLLVAVPLGLGLALFVNEYASPRLRRPLTSAVDLLAALPSLIFGMWGLFALQGPLTGFAQFFADHLGAIPIFRVNHGDELSRSGFIGGVVVGLMILPIVTSVTRDVMSQCPREQCEGALALGGSRWGMIRSVLLPFSRSGIVGAVLLGFGRALGETIAITIIVSLQIQPNTRVLTIGGGSIAQQIATKFGEARSLEVSALVAAGLALFVLTLAVNLGARRIVRRARSANVSWTTPAAPTSVTSLGPDGAPLVDLRDLGPVVGSGNAGGGAPGPDAPPVVIVDRPRAPRSVSRNDLVEYVIAVVSGLLLSTFLCVVLDWRHPLTFGIWAAVGALVVEWVLVRDRAGSIQATDRVITVLVYLSAAIAVVVLGWMIAYVVIKGIGGISWSFFTTDMSKVGPLDPGGGAFHAIIGTLEQTAMATAVAVPVGVLTAVYLHEIRGRMSPVVRFVSDAMSGLPSIVAGLLVYTLWVTSHGFSGLSASMALIIVMLPIITRTAEEILRTIDPGLRESALALGSPHWRAVTKVILPTARAGLVTAAILGIARVVGETAPALLTAFGSASVNKNPFHGQQSDLPLFVYQLIRQPNATQIQRAWAGALVLIAIVLVLFVVARFISARATKRLGGSR